MTTEISLGLDTSNNPLFQRQITTSYEFSLTVAAGTVTITAAQLAGYQQVMISTSAAAINVKQSADPFVVPTKTPQLTTTNQLQLQGVSTMPIDDTVDLDFQSLGDTSINVQLFKLPGN